MNRYPLLTRDEAAAMVGAAALEMAESLAGTKCSDARIRRLLAGEGNAARLGERAHHARVALRRALAHARAAGWGDVIEDELAGAASYLGLEPDVAQQLRAARGSGASSAFTATPRLA